jgi:hypothetical protein
MVIEEPIFMLTELVICKYSSSSAVTDCVSWPVQTPN